MDERNKEKANRLVIINDGSGSQWVADASQVAKYLAKNWISEPYIGDSLLYTEPFQEDTYCRETPYDEFCHHIDDITHELPYDEESGDPDIDSIRADAAKFYYMQDIGNTTWLYEK